MKKICFGMICMLLTGLSLQATPVEENLVTNVINERIEFQEINFLSEFNKYVIEAPGVIVIEFYSQTCPGCVKMLPLLESLAYSLSDKVIILKSDINNSIEILREFKLNRGLQVTSVPSLFIFKDGKFVDCTDKVMNKEELFAFVNQYIQD
jgi:thioredoxin 1